MSEFDVNKIDKEPVENGADTAVVTENPTTPPQKKSGFIKGLVEQIELIVVAFAIIIVAFSFMFRTCEVSGASMENTLYDSETVLISNVFYSPKRNDIIVFHQTGTYNEPIVKRVIGLPGDTVKIEYLDSSMKVTVTDSNGESTVLNEDYVKYEGRGFYVDSVTYVEEGTIFVMGDNRRISADSRSDDIGLVDTRRVLGRVIIRLTPFSKFGKIN